MPEFNIYGPKSKPPSSEDLMRWRRALRRRERRKRKRDMTKINIDMR